MSILQLLPKCILLRASSSMMDILNKLKEDNSLIRSQMSDKGVKFRLKAV